MVGHRWIQSLFILTGLHFTGASLFIRLGDDVSLPCNNLIPDQSKCDATTWLYSKSASAAVELVKLGQIIEKAASQSNRLSLTENCSLVIEKVTDQDVGHYTCRQFDKSGRQQGGDTEADLSVVAITEHEAADAVTLNCFVWTCGRCRLTVTWLLEEGALDVKPSQSACNATVTVSSSLCSSSCGTFVCEVRDGDDFQGFAANPRRNRPSLQWLFILAALLLVALVILVVIGWKRSRRNASRNGDNDGTNSKPAGTHSAPEPGHNAAEPADAVFYTSISFNAGVQGHVQVQTKGGADKPGSVTYSTVRTSSADPCSLYASIK